MTTTIIIPVDAPNWAHRLAQDIDAALAVIRSQKSPARLPAYSKADLPAAASWPYCWVFVKDAAAGAQPAFSDGSAWRLAADRSIVS